jgi:hydrogenase-4 component B
MVTGSLLALVQSNMKRMLAYSTISQMGYVIMGIGISAYLGYLGVYGVAGSLYHMLNHTLFKALLIMAAGTVYFSTSEVNLYRLGGLWSKMPVVALLAMVGLMGMTGMPGFNGYASKTLLHHGLLQAMESGPESLVMAEWLYKAASAGTVAYAIKFFYFVFLRRSDTPLTNRSIITPYGEVVGPSRWMTPVMGVLAVLVVIAGIIPRLWMNQLMIPAAISVSRVPDLVEIRLMNLNFWNGKDLLGAATVHASWGVFCFTWGADFICCMSSFPAGHRQSGSFCTLSPAFVNVSQRTV